MEEVWIACVVGGARSCFGIKARRSGGAPPRFVIVTGTACLRAVCEKQHRDGEETESAGDHLGLHEVLRVGAAVRLRKT
jgi:hypothetical protein